MGREKIASQRTTTISYSSSLAPNAEFHVIYMLIYCNLCCQTFFLCFFSCTYHSGALCSFLCILCNTIKGKFLLQMIIFCKGTGVSSRMVDHVHMHKSCAFFLLFLFINYLQPVIYSEGNNNSFMSDQRSHLVKTYGNFDVSVMHSRCALQPRES